MKIKTGLDILNTPIIVCKKNEKAVVSYKNQNARERIKTPTIDNGMYKHISSHCINDYIDIINGGKPKVVTLTIDNILNNALVGNYIFNGDEVTIWIFLDMLQIKSYNSFFGYIIDRNEKIYNDIIQLVDSFNNNEDAVFVIKNDSRIYKIQNILSSIINKLFDTPYSYKNKIYNVSETLNNIITYSEKTMAKFGCRFKIITDRLLEYNNLYMKDIGIFLAVYAHIITLGINFSYNKEGFVELYTDEKHIIIELNFTLKNPAYYIENCSDFDLLIKTFPQECFNMMLLNQYIKYKSWDSQFDITNQERNNFKLRIYIDLIDDYVSILHTNTIKNTEFDYLNDEIIDFLNTLIEIHLGE